MAEKQSKRPAARDEDLVTLTPPMNPDGSRPAPPSAADAEDQQLVDDALAGNIKLPGVNVNSTYNPSNPYAGEGRAADYQAPKPKSFWEGVGDYIVDKTGLGESPEPAKPPQTKPETGPLVFADGGQSSTVAAKPQIVPAHEVALVNPKRQATERAAYEAQIAGVGDQSKAVDEQKAAADQAANAQAGVNKAKSVGEDYLAALNNQFGADTDARAKADKAMRDEYRAKMDAFSADLANDRIGVRPSLPQKVTWTIAKVLGGIGQSILHENTNAAAEMIDNYIKQEIDNQKANHEVKRGRLKDMETFYGLAVDQAKDQNERLKLAQGYALEAAKHQVQSLADLAQTPVAQAKAAELQGLLSEKQGQLATHKGEVRAAMEQRGIAENKWVPEGAAGGGGKPVDAKNVFYDPVTGQHYAAKNEKSRENLVRSGQAVLEFKDAAQRLTKALEAMGTGDRAAAKIGYSTDARSEAQTAYNHALGIVRKAQNDGVWKKSEAEMLEGTLTPPDNFTGNPQKQLALINGTVLNTHKSAMAVEAPDPVVAAPQQPGTAPKNIPTGQNYQAPKNVTPSSVGFTPVGAKAHGGDVSSEQPYLVGEKGPELVVPNKPGFVLTALQTAALHGAPPTQQQMATLPSGAKSAIQRFAEKAGVAREDGGPVYVAPPGPNPLPPPKLPHMVPEHASAPVPAPAEPWQAVALAALRAEDRRKKDAAEHVSQWLVSQRPDPTAQDAEDDEADDAQAKAYAHGLLRKRSAPSVKIGAAEIEPSVEVGQAQVEPSVEVGQAQVEPAAVDVGPAQVEAAMPAPVTWRDRLMAFLSRKREEGGAVMPLYEPPGQELHQSLDGHAYYAMNDAAPQGASLSAPTPRYSVPQAPASAPAPRPKTPAELMAAANALQQQKDAEYKASLAAGPAARRLQSGSPATNYETELTQGAETAFRDRFGLPLSKEERVLGNESGSDYDLRGAYARGDTDGKRVVKVDGGFYFPGHLPDTFKKPPHETFSNESQYAQYAPTLAGSWQGERYMRNPQRPPEWLEHYMSAEDEGPPIGSDYEDDEDAVAHRAQGGAMHPRGLAASIARDFEKAKRAC